MNYPVHYLENQDINSQGDLVVPQIPKNMPVVIMVQASWCPHCTNAKPAFQEFAEKYKDKVFVATIQADGERDTEKQLGKRINNIKKTFRGFPDYLLFYNGKMVDKEIGGRSVDDLAKFAGM